MCGLVGIFKTKSLDEVNANLLQDMNESQFHRGPDQGGLHREPGVGLGHRRLSIIDLSSGKQPLFNEDESVVVVYNGEIYNFQSLMAELLKLGHQFKTRCDTEVIVHAWEQWGEDCVERFRGMFAFALWDRHQKTLFLARDRLGIKPLYYSLLANGDFIFSSELKALEVHPQLNKQINPQAVEDYFAYGYIPEPKTIYQNVYKLCPAQTLTFVHGESQQKLNFYWDIPFKEQTVGSQSELIQDFTNRFAESINIRMLAEVPLGAFLSGGVDSSAVVALMAEQSKERINTCSISFSDPKFDESSYASEVAQRYNSQHLVETVDIDDFDLVDQLALIYDEPYADSSAIPTYRVCELARRKVTVALSGDGGDENLAGYGRYQSYLAENNLRSMLPDFVRKNAMGLMGKLYPKLAWAPRVFRAKALFQSLARDSVEAYFHEISVIRDPLRQSLYSQSFSKQLGGYNALQVFKDHAQKAPTKHPLSLIQYLDLKTYLVGDILTKVDRASMAHSLEVRVPFLDHQFVEWMSNLPPDVKLKDGVGKSLLKKAMEPKLSDGILYRKKKGFAVPLANWFRGPLKDRVSQAINSESLNDSGIFNRQVLRSIYDDHLSNRQDNSAALWSILMFDSFERKSSASHKSI